MAKPPAKTPAKKTAPAKKAPASSPKKVAKTAPAKKVPVKAPVKAAPAKKTPVKAPAKAAPAKQTPVKAPVKAAPTPAKKAAASAAKPAASKGKKIMQAVVAATPAAVITGKVQSASPDPRNTTKLVQKGRGVVDAFVANAGQYHVVEKDNCVYQCTLNQTNVGSNNNKFYVIQLLESDVQPVFFLYTRWGRVGVSGQTKMEPCSNVMAGISAFESKFTEKTRNYWVHRDKFEKKPGKYYLMDIDYGADEEAEEEKAAQKQKLKELHKPPVPKCTLKEEVQDIMRIISNKDFMLSMMKELDVDTKRMPLGKISKSQIAKAYECLKTIEKGLKKPGTDLEAPTALFYTLIPHDFGFKRPPLINTPIMLKAKVEMLETLAELEIASKIIEMEVMAKHPLDTTYESLNCDLIPLDHDSEEFQRVVEYTTNTQGKTHGDKLTVQSVFRIHRESEKQHDQTIKKVGNRHMLWHGSRATNFIGILSQGLRIAPKEAPCTGYMFGKGIYLADCCSKSANYCNAHISNKTGLMLLCEAALGKTKDLKNSMYMEEPQPGTKSTKGCGWMIPDPKGSTTVDGVVWPKGKLVEKNRADHNLYYNEFIVYDVAQVKMRYLIKMKFN